MITFLLDNMLKVFHLYLPYLVYVRPSVSLLHLDLWVLSFVCFLSVACYSLCKAGTSDRATSASFSSLVIFLSIFLDLYNKVEVCRKHGNITNPINVLFIRLSCKDELTITT